MTTKYFRFEDKSYDDKRNAQVNLQGRTHYVDDDTLKYHKSRILKCHITDNGLLLAIVESYQATFDGKRLFRPVIFNMLGGVVDRVTGTGGYKTKQQAIKAMWESLDAIDAVQETKQAFEHHRKWTNWEVDRVLKELNQ